MSVKVSPIEIQTAAHWNLIGCTMTAPLAVLSPISILPPSWSLGALITAKGKNREKLKNVTYFNSLLP
jgi:hypothetical protein